MRKLITISLLVVSFCAHGQKAKGPVMHWHQYSAKEQAIPASDYFPLDKEKILCYLSNNDTSMYIDLIIPDPGVQNHILNTGMNIWIDLSGKEVKSMGVRYPMGSNNVKAALQRKGDAMTDSEKSMFFRNSSLEMAYEIEIAGFGEGIPPRVPSKGGSGFSSSMRYSDDGNLLYRMVIPMKSVTLLEEKGKIVPFSIGLEYGQIMLPRPQGTNSGSGKTVTISGSSVVSVPVGEINGQNVPLQSQPVGGKRSDMASSSGMGSSNSGKGGTSANNSMAAEPAGVVWIKGLLPAKK